MEAPVGLWEWFKRRAAPAPEVEVELEDGDDEEEGGGVAPELADRLIQHLLERPVVGLCLNPDKGFFPVWVETAAPEYLEYRPLDPATGAAGPRYLLPLGSVHEICLDSVEVLRAWLQISLNAPMEEEPPDAHKV
jgi:hypothetical protein